MARYVAFLRAINVGGHVVKMDVLKAEFEALGLTKVETFIASGNVLFESRSSNLSALEEKIERALAKKLGYEVATFIRTLADVHAIVRYKPFSDDRLEAASALNVGLLKRPLDQPTRDALAGLKTDIDDFHANEAQLFWICEKKQGESKISNAVFERTLKVKATFRGIRTMQKLAARYAP